MSEIAWKVDVGDLVFSNRSDPTEQIMVWPEMAGRRPDEWGPIRLPRGIAGIVTYIDDAGNLEVAVPDFGCVCQSSITCWVTADQWAAIEKGRSMP